MNRLHMALIPLVLFSFAGRANARHLCDVCGTTCCHELVEKTILVPQRSIEYRMIKTTVCKPEIHQKTICVTRRIPVVHTVTKCVRVSVPVKTTKQVCYKVCKPIWREVVKTCKVMVPHKFKKTGVRMVCRKVPVHDTVTVCKDHGHWAEQPCQCGSCCGVCKVWVPKIVAETIPVTCWKTELVEEPYEYFCTKFTCEMRQKVVRVCDYQYETRVRDVVCLKFIPKMVEKQCNVTTYKCVPEQRVVNCTVMVPHEVMKEVAVPVCKMVPKTVMCKVPVCCDHVH